MVSDRRGEREDDEQTPLTNSTTVSITVRDVNDNLPYFNRCVSPSQTKLFSVHNKQTLCAPNTLCLGIPYPKKLSQTANSWCCHHLRQSNILCMCVKCAIFDAKEVPRENIFSPFHKSFTQKGFRLYVLAAQPHRFVVLETLAEGSVVGDGISGSVEDRDSEEIWSPFYYYLVDEEGQRDREFLLL